MSILPRIIEGICKLITMADEHWDGATNDKDFKETRCIKFKTDKEKIEMIEYAPNAFANIRKLNSIKTKQFLESWRDLETTLPWERSTGRSGSLFYSTPDKRYFIKTIKSKERKTLLNVLKDYYTHLKNYQNSLMMRVYGLYKVFEPYEYDILLFANVFPHDISINVSYDLKGRLPKKGKSWKERGVISKGTRKDNELQRKICFRNTKEKKFFLQQLKTDTTFLQVHNIMDYSLLVGIKYVGHQDGENIQKEDNQNPQDGENIHKQTNQNPQDGENIKKEVDHDLQDDENIKKEIDHDYEDTQSEGQPKGDMQREGQPNGEMAVEKEILRLDKPSLKGHNENRIVCFRGLNPMEPDLVETYYMGIIDCFTPYSNRKKVSNCCKITIWPKQSISTVDPEYYSERFLDFMENGLVYTPE